MPTKFHKVKRNAKKARGIQWHKRKGKGSHGSLVGPDKEGCIHSFAVPIDQQSEIEDSYLKAISLRFNIPLAVLKK